MHFIRSTEEVSIHRTPKQQPMFITSLKTAGSKRLNTSSADQRGSQRARSQKVPQSPESPKWPCCETQPRANRRCLHRWDGNEVCSLLTWAFASSALRDRLISAGMLWAWRRAPVVSESDTVQSFCFISSGNEPKLWTLWFSSACLFLAISAVYILQLVLAVVIELIIKHFTGFIYSCGLWNKLLYMWVSSVWPERFE